MASGVVSVHARTRGLWRIRLLEMLALVLFRVRPSLVVRFARHAAERVRIEMRYGRGEWRDTGIRLVAHSDGTITRIEAA